MSTQQSTGYHTRAVTRSGLASPPPPVFGTTTVVPSPEAPSSPRPASLDSPSEIAGPSVAGPEYVPSAADPEHGVTASGSVDFPLGSTSFNNEVGDESGPDECADDGGWTPVTRRTARNHSQNSNSTSHSNKNTHTPNFPIASNAEEVNSNSTIAQVTRGMSIAELVAVAERYEALAASTRADMARNCRASKGPSGETAGETIGNDNITNSDVSVKTDSNDRGVKDTREEHDGTWNSQAKSHVGNNEPSEAPELSKPPKVNFSAAGSEKSENIPASNRSTEKGDGEMSGQTQVEFAEMKQQIKELKRMLKASQNPATPSELQKAQKVVDEFTSDKTNHRATPRRLAAQSFIAKAIRGMSQVATDPPTPDPSDSSSDSNGSDAGSDRGESEGEKSSAAARHRRMSSRRSSGSKGAGKMRIRPKEPTTPGPNGGSAFNSRPQRNEFRGRGRGRGGRGYGPPRGESMRAAAVEMPPLRDTEEDDSEDGSDPTGIPSWFEDQYLMRQKVCLRIVNDNGTQYKGYNLEGCCIGDTLGMAVARLLEFSQPYPGDERLCLTSEKLNYRRFRVERCSAESYIVGTG
ncbi:hypothetical protein B0H17DRAFT_1144718 [Mycena rosella]|uniref:Uncharacterized protein n=1 Tax=Mycena rosella TaxID=1033263 RepID=A0AAD7CW37_MYCRO|nr:hypothetical protein B0H17DRAFT_1144718 [Mycena rosella]